MQTPKEFNQNLERGIITQEMLKLALLSVNKRAKNMRDKQRGYRNTRLSNYYFVDKFHYEENYKLKKEGYYDQKDILLSVATPKCIHQDQNNYYLFFDFGDCGFHKPISKSDIVKFNSLEVLQIGHLTTRGKDIKELISC